MTETQTRRLNSRQAPMWSLFDFSAGVGLEIGPLHNPVVPRAYADVRYVDVFDREALQASYAGNPIVALDNIPEIDYVLSDGDRVRSIPEAVGEQTRFDWVMASHVVEHVPDLVTWLDQIAQVTDDGGALVLAVPDRRYCFDLHRPATSLGQVLQAHESGETMPSVRAVFDHNRSLVTVRPETIWAGETVGYDSRRFDLQHVLDKVERARAGEYLDSHVWLFTPGSFLEQIVELRTLGLSAWRVEKLVPTQRNKLEFYAVLRRLPRAGWDADLLADEPQPTSVPDWMAETLATSSRLVDAEKRAARAEAELAKARSRLASMKARNQARLGYRVRKRAQVVPGYPVLRRVRRHLRARLGSRTG